MDTLGREDAPAIAIRGLRKTYGKGEKAKEALKGVDLEIPRGSFFGLLGPNGAGKSTLINILAGLVIKSAGEAQICGYDIDREVRQARSSIGVVPQELVIDTFFTVEQALEIQAGYYGIPKSRRQTQAIIEALGLADKARASSRTLSGGMRRRLLVGKALVHSPPVLILDEPTAGVDVELREQLWDYVRGLNRQGVTVLLTTHYLEEAEELCDRIAIINHGALIACDTKAALIKTLDRKQVTIQFAEPLQAVPETMHAYDCEVTPEGFLTVKYRPSEMQMDALIQAACAAGLSIRDLSTQEADLEDIFRALVRGGGEG